jgi:hypothetical protein
MLGLIEAICSDLYDRTSPPETHAAQVFTMQGHVILELWEEGAVPLAEHIVSTITLSYDWLGAGFNTVVGGRSIDSAASIHNWEYGFWASRQDFSGLSARVYDNKQKIFAVVDGIRRLTDVEQKKEAAKNVFKQMQETQVKTDKAKEDIEKLVDGTVPKIREWADVVKGEIEDYQSMDKYEHDLDEAIAALQAYNMAAEARKRKIVLRSWNRTRDLTVPGLTEEEVQGIVSGSP